MSALQRLCDNLHVKIECTWGARLPIAEQNEWQRKSNGYTVVLKYQRRQMTTDFWMGIAHTSEPSAADVISCLISDSTALNESFEEWCDELGYDSDSISAQKTYDACRDSALKIKRLLGSDFYRFARADH